MVYKDGINQRKKRIYLQFYIDILLFWYKKNRYYCTKKTYKYKNWNITYYIFGFDPDRYYPNSLKNLWG